jgi:DinB family protein
VNGARATLSPVLHLKLDVNDVARREAFLYGGVVDALGALRSDTPAQWGHMTPQQMVEHLMWSFEVSRGQVVVECPIPEAKRTAWKAFLYDDRPMMREFRNPALVNGLPALRHGGIAEAVAAVRAEAEAFRTYAAAHPDVLHVHPVFGPMNADEWARAHYKHLFHHLLQFDLAAAEP